MSPNRPIGWNMSNKEQRIMTTANNINTFSQHKGYSLLARPPNIAVMST